MLYLKHFTISAILTFFVFFCLGLFIQPLSGDLTRLGNLPERDFGWNAIQPQISIKENTNIRNPSVIVLGDSFSEKNIWQSVAMENSQSSFLTFHWENIGNPSCLESWLLSLKNIYPSMQLIVVETIERDFLARFIEPQSYCQNNKAIPIKVSPRITESTRNFDWKHFIPDPIYAIQSVFNSLEKFDKFTKNGNTLVTPLTQSHYFSNKKSGLILYYAGDDDKKDWQPEQMRTAISVIKRIQELAKSKGIPLIISVVPDKSTIYGNIFKTPQFESAPPDVWAELNKQQVTQINLKQILSSAVDTTIDLYLPNDTHFGNNGYILMGNAVSNYLKEIQPTSKP